MPQNEPKLLDIVEIVTPPASSPLQRGDVGTVVEVLQPDGLEIEVVDDNGDTRYVAPIKSKDVKVVARAAADVHARDSRSLGQVPPSQRRRHPRKAAK